MSDSPGPHPSCIREDLLIAAVCRAIVAAPSEVREAMAPYTPGDIYLAGPDATGHVAVMWKHVELDRVHLDQLSTPSAEGYGWN